MASTPSNATASRRRFLKAAALGGVSIQLGQSAALHAAVQSPLATGKKCIFLFLHGGPSQFETFDPKPKAPSEIRCVNGDIATALPGIRFGSAFPKLAAMADRLTIVRSYASGSGNHDIKPIVCKDSLDANIGSLYGRVVGANDSKTGMPKITTLFPRAVDPETNPKVTQFGKFDATGTLGSAFTPFEVGGGGDLQNDMTLNIPTERFHSRTDLLSGLDRLRRANDRSERYQQIDPLRAQAYDALLGNIAEAFDLSREGAAMIEKYDTSPLVSPRSISEKWNNHQKYKDNAKTLGKLMLLARRLCEAGCNFVTVTTSFVWDMHSDANNAGVAEGMRYMGGPLDHAASTFLEDRDQRGLTDDILLVATGEMGRNPKINKRAGRDHWGGLTPLLLSGGGISDGQVIGKSDADGGRPSSETITNQQLISSILQTLIDPAEARLQTDLPADLLRLIADRGIPGLHG